MPGKSLDASTRGGSEGSIENSSLRPAPAHVCVNSAPRSHNKQVGFRCPLNGAGNDAKGIAHPQPEGRLCQPPLL